MRNTAEYSGPEYDSAEDFGNNPRLPEAAKSEGEDLGCNHHQRNCHAKELSESQYSLWESYRLALDGPQSERICGLEVNWIFTRNYSSLCVYPSVNVKFKTSMGAA
jgi:hypothetical protein